MVDRPNQSNYDPDMGVTYKLLNICFHLTFSKCSRTKMYSILGVVWVLPNLHYRAGVKKVRETAEFNLNTASRILKKTASVYRNITIGNITSVVVSTYIQLYII